jgi:hypothetical protein
MGELDYLVPNPQCRTFLQVNEALPGRYADGLGSPTEGEDLFRGDAAPRLTNGLGP